MLAQDVSETTFSTTELLEYLDREIEACAVAARGPARTQGREQSRAQLRQNHLLSLRSIIRHRARGMNPPAEAIEALKAARAALAEFDRRQSDGRPASLA
jgi:hypothetical protein